MSKKCCGIIYKDEKFCTLCGKPLQDVLDMEEVEKIAASVRGDMTVPEVEKKEEEIKEEPKEEIKEELGASEQVVEAEAEKASETKLEEEKEVKPEEEAKKEDTEKAEVAEIAEGDEDEDDEDEDEDDGTASAGLKFFGTLMILLMFAAIAAVGLGIYFIMLSPFYKNHNINEPVVYEQVSTDTDVTNIQTRPGLIPVTIEQATPEDATTEAVSTDTDATETDAADEEASEDME